jgi:hypothetical protein
VKADDYNVNYMQEIVSSDEAGLGSLLAAELAQARKTLPAVELAQGPLSAESSSALLRKEAVYSVACTLDYELSDYVDFSDWLYGSLLPELSVVGAASFCCALCIVGRPSRRRVPSGGDGLPLLTIAPSLDSPIT